MSESYRIIIAPEARVALQSAYDWMSRRSPQSAEKWVNGFLDAIESLEKSPMRCPLAPESEHFDQQVRQLLYGARKRRYRALFTVEDEIVKVHFIRHYAQDTIAKPPM